MKPRPLYFAFLLIFSARAVADDGVLRIGVVAPLTGEVAAWGEDIRNVLLFAQRELPGRRVEFIFEDDHCLGRDAVTAATKLVNVDHVDRAIVVCTESVLASAPIFEKSRTLVISPATSGAAVSRAGEYIFRTWPSDQLATDVLADHLLQHGLNRVAVLTEERGYSEELGRAFNVSAGGRKLTVIERSFPSDTPDHRSLLLNLRKQNPSALLLNANSERNLYELVRRVHDLRWDVPLFGVILPGNRSFLELAGPLAENIVFVNAPSIEGSATPESAKLYQRYVKDYGKLRSSDFVLFSTYETFRLLLDSAGQADPVAWLYRSSFDGLFGKYSFDRNGDVVGVRHELRKIVHEESKPIN